jgi:pimeloyl-ACP methyl ester carboxylesterase
VIGFEDHGSGSELVLVHGVGLDRGMWHRCWPGLAARHRVRLVDLPGHGRSPAVPPGVTLAALASDLIEVVDRPSHLVGFSLGALVATQAALTRPDLAASLTLVSSVASRRPAEREAVHARLRTAEHDFEAAVATAIERWFPARWRQAEPGLVAQVRDTLLGVDRQSYLACYRVFATADAELWPRLGELRVPVLAVTGSEDPGSTPAMTANLAGAVPGARALIIDGCRHLLPLEAPGRLVTEILQFTTEVDRDRCPTAQV